MAFRGQKELWVKHPIMPFKIFLIKPTGWRFFNRFLFLKEGIEKAQFVSERNVISLKPL